MYFTVLFICLAAICKAIADTLRDHFDTSVFKWKNPKWWNPVISWKYVGYIRFTKYHPDAWHLCNSGMIIFFSLAIAFHRPVIQWYYEWAIAGVVFNLVFNLFYGKIFYRPKK